ncbi:hypothetical protein PTD2_17495 [Pseudoalteromonas tunicata D2]|uniref:Uncharacterized protein n=1 Tax=Pseudoalteromonas tunicata D2 TaxID=87626 RepID=A4CBA2_9GAMM|nr:hypothetical protein PTD2_17495 [Pseudoalteromonas tunicata D2]
MLGRCKPVSEGEQSSVVFYGRALAWCLLNCDSLTQSAFSAPFYHRLHQGFAHREKQTN